MEDWRSFERKKERHRGEGDWQTYWRIGEVLGEEEGEGKGAIATKAVQVCTPLLLEFLPIFDFSACSIPEYLIVLLIFVWTLRATNCSIEIGRSFVCPILVLILVLLHVVDVF